MLFWNRITQLERLRVRRITLATRQTFAADQSSSIVASFVLGGFLETLHVDLDTDLVAEFEAVGDGFCWIEHANDCPCNPVPIPYIYMHVYTNMSGIFAFEFVLGKMRE